MNELQEYFDLCVNYWMRSSGVSKDVAIVRALWWDCVEAWNFDRTWTDEKVAFVNKFRKYTPYSPLPDTDKVREGKA